MRFSMAMIRRWLSRAGRDRRWISDPRERAVHDDVVRERLDPRGEDGDGELTSRARRSAGKPPVIDPE